MAIFFLSSTAAGASADFTVVAGTPQTVFLTQANTTAAFPADALIDIQIKSTDNQYTTIGSMTTQRVATQIDAAATYRLYRHACSSALGAEKV